MRSSVSSLDETLPEKRVENTRHSADTQWSIFDEFLTLTEIAMIARAG